MRNKKDTYCIFRPSGRNDTGGNTAMILEDFWGHNFLIGNPDRKGQVSIRARELGESSGKKVNDIV